MASPVPNWGEPVPDQLIFPFPIIAARPAAGGGAGRLRACAMDDLPAIARLFGDVFRHTTGTPPTSLIDHLREVYFEHPWRDPAVNSQVFVSEDGRVDGFIGVLPLRLRHRGQPVRAAIAGALMVRDPAAQPMAGARLLRSFMAGPQTLSIGDTANWTSKTLWERLGGRTLPLASMEWLKILRSVSFGVSVLRNRLPAPLRPLLAGLPILTGLRRVRAVPAAEHPWSAVTVDDAAFLECFAELSSTLEITLDMDDEAGRWFLAQAARQTRHGPLYRRVVRDRAGRIIGCYLIHAKRGAPAQTLQVLASPRHGEAVFASILAFALELGSNAVRGQSQPALMDAIFRARCILRHTCATVVDTDDPALMEALERGSAPFGGFFGETWMRLVSDDFA